MELHVNFESDRETLAGVLFRPDNAQGKLPTVVCAGGWCYTKEIVLPHIARIVNDGAVQVLAPTFLPRYTRIHLCCGPARARLPTWSLPTLFVPD